MLQITELPEILQEWLSNDDKSGAILNDLRNKHGLTDQQAIGLGWLVYHIFTKDVPPEQFISYLSGELNLNEDLARAIAKDLWPILNTMGDDLRRIGIDIKKILPDSESDLLGKSSIGASSQGDVSRPVFKRK